MEKKRSFTKLKKSMSAQEFDNFCKKITEEYAKSEAQFARTYFTQHYNISESCFYKILEHAVVSNLVEDVIVTKMTNKAVQNQNAHKNGAGVTTIAKYAKMYAKRSKNIAMQMTDEEIKTIAIDFADNPDIAKIDLAASYGITTKVLGYSLERAIEENIVEDKVVDAMEQRSIKNTRPENVELTKNYFTALRNKRESYKQGATLE